MLVTAPPYRVKPINPLNVVYNSENVSYPNA
jgi:hypothetical protein